MIFREKTKKSYWKLAKYFFLGKFFEEKWKNLTENKQDNFSEHFFEKTRKNRIDFGFFILPTIDYFDNYHVILLRTFVPKFQESTPRVNETKIRSSPKLSRFHFQLSQINRNRSQIIIYKRTHIIHSPRSCIFYANIVTHFSIKHSIFDPIIELSTQLYHPYARKSRKKKHNAVAVSPPAARVVRNISFLADYLIQLGVYAVLSFK